MQLKNYLRSPVNIKKLEDNTMKNIKGLLETLEQQEQELVFDSFTNSDALKLGTILAGKIEQYEEPLTVRIFIGDVIVYQYTKAGDEEFRFGWTYRKYQLVKKTGHSSMHSRIRAQFLGEFADLTAQPEVYGFGCGAFPITVKGKGIIGAATVSGLPDPDDHPIVVHAIEELLGKKTAELPDEVDRAFLA